MVAAAEVEGLGLSIQDIAAYFYADGGLVS